MRDLTIVFDLDGTLVETAPDLIAATNHVMGLAGLGPIAADQLRPSISFGAAAMIRKGLEIHGAPADPQHVGELFERFIAFDERNIAVSSHAYPGLEAALDRVSARGARLAVCTNKQARLSVELLTTLNLIDRFAALAGRDTFPVCKPHPDHLVGAIRMAGGDPACAIMVGDSATDVATARAAGVPVIGVPFGYTDVPMHDLLPDVIMDHYDGLDAAIEQVRPR